MFIDEFIEKVKEYDNVIIHRHQRPDGDCIGCQMGLKAILQESFPEKHIYAVGDNIPDYLKFVGTPDIVDDSLYANSLVIVVDTSNPTRIEDARWEKGAYIIKIDHHSDSPEFGNLSYVDASSPACASMIAEMVANSNGVLKLNQTAATALYFGIVTDTGRFRYSGVNGAVLKNAGMLLDYNVDIQTMYEGLYIDDLNTLKLQGYVLTHFKTTPNGVVYIYFTKAMMKKYHVSKEDAANLVNSLGSIRGSLVWVAFIDQLNAHDKTKDLDPAKEVRCRIRSRRVTINTIAAKYRGGGHAQAAGSTIYSKKEMKSLLNELDTALKQYKLEHPDAF